MRQKFSSNGLMFLFCVSCGKLVAYSARADVLSIAETAHSQNCPFREDDPAAPKSFGSC